MLLCFGTVSARIMAKKPPQKAFHMSTLVDMDNPHAVYAQMKTVIHLFIREFDFTCIQKVFIDILRLFHGEYPGYRACNTRYHNLKHTTDALMAMVRLIHGAWLSGIRFRKTNISLSIITTLMHDTGYIQKREENQGTGGQYTLVHVQRSVDFMKSYFARNGYSSQSFNQCAAMLNCTGFHTRTGDIVFPDQETELLGKMLGTADLTGQIADRDYIRKLPFLYKEFEEAGIDVYHSEEDLMEKTVDFFQTTRERLSLELDSADRFFRPHFREHYGIDKNLYAVDMENNLQHLKYLLESRKIHEKTSCMAAGSR